MIMKNDYDEDYHCGKMMWKWYGAIRSLSNCFYDK